MSLSADAWGAIATASATIVALGIAVHDVVTRRADQRDAEMAQARLITGGANHLDVFVRNDSQLPIYEVRFGHLHREAPAPHHGMPNEDVDRLGPGQEFRMEVLWVAPGRVESGRGRDKGVTGVFQFLDANGLCWERHLNDRQTNPRRTHAFKRLGGHEEESNRVLTQLYRERDERTSRRDPTEASP